MSDIDKIEEEKREVGDSRFDLPTFDKLSDLRQRLVVAYAGCLDKELAYKAAGYKEKVAAARNKKINELFSNPEILKAIEEYLQAKLLQLDNGRAALATRLMYMSLATITDVCERVEWHNAQGKKVPNRYTWIPKDPDKIEPQFIPALALVKADSYGQYYFDNMGQVRITNQLAKLMLWDQQELDQGQPIHFHFGDIQDSEYVKPDDGVDLSAVDDAVDEVDDLIG